MIDLLDEQWAMATNYYRSNSGFIVKQDMGDFVLATYFDPAGDLKYSTWYLATLVLG